MKEVDHLDDGERPIFVKKWKLYHYSISANEQNYSTFPRERESLIYIDHQLVPTKIYSKRKKERKSRVEGKGGGIYW